ncbi:MAG: hypothetical protein IKL40_01035 [Clostridia bacterium]|nr:hypothetical protein [Clostridia bacterium]
MKSVTLPSAVISNTKKTLKYDNTPIVDLNIDSICFNGESKHIKSLNIFYENLTSAFSSFAENNFYEFALNDYISDESPRKKYRYVPFSLVLTVAFDKQNDNTICVKLKITVSKKRKMLAQKDISHSWTIGKKHTYLSLSHSHHPHKNKVGNNP